MAIQTNSSDIHLRSSNAMQLQSTSAFSITCWINAVWNQAATISMVGIYGPIDNTPLGQPATALQIGTKSGNGELSTWSWGGGVMVQTAANTMLVHNNQWTMVCYTFNGTTHSLYVNGIEVATSSTSQIPGYLNQVYINGYPGSGTGETASFQVDQYALYRRTLSPAEIQTMANSKGVRHGITNGLICRYEFDELSQGQNVSSIPDLSGNIHTLSTVGVGTPMTYNYVNTLANSNIRPVQ